MPNAPCIDFFIDIVSTHVYVNVQNFNIDYIC